MRSEVGLTVPVGAGITPGSGPGHLALFGYDPLKFDIGRGVLEATGIDFALTPTDVAARGNFCTLDGAGDISDRRAGRVATETSSKLVERLRQISVPGVEVFVEPVREHRFVLVLRGEGLGDAVTTTDPQREGSPPLAAKGADASSQRTAQVVNEFVWIMSSKYRVDMKLLSDVAKNLFLLYRMDVVDDRTIAAAIEVAMRYRLSYWDSLIVSSAIKLNCPILYSEDLQHEQVLEKSITIANPFLSPLP